MNCAVATVVLLHSYLCVARVPVGPVIFGIKQFRAAAASGSEGGARTQKNKHDDDDDRDGHKRRRHINQKRKE